MQFDFLYKIMLIILIKQTIFINNFNFDKKFFILDLFEKI